MAVTDLEAVARHVAGCVSQLTSVAGAYLYGSVLGELHAHSDIDVALVVPETISDDLMASLQLEAEAQLRLGRWKGHPFHVTVLDPRQPLFSFRPLHEGRLVYVGNEQVLTSFLERVARAYADLYPRHRRAVQEVLEE